jgi:histone acetyltransferase (RNA polymerase elongator complex component)
MHVENVLLKATRSKSFDVRRNPEVAFYGGTFTRLPIGRTKELLMAVAPYIRQGLFRSIRISTRPDAIDDARLKVMKRYGVRTVELGVQSMNDHVLALSKRGHTALETVNAVKTLKKHSFRVGIQLMPGLPGDSEEKCRATITQVIDLHPDMVRLYPTLVIRGTELARLYEEQRFCPMELEAAVEICAESCIRLEAEDIPVIRIGLMSSPSLLEKGQIVAGPWHPAFGFLVRSNIYQKNIEPLLPRLGEVSRMQIRAPKREIPLLKGHKNLGIRLIEEKTRARVMGVTPDNSVPPSQIVIEKT